MINGSITALVTPFNEQGGIDFHALERLVSYQLENGIDGLVVAGTTGESATLAAGEFTMLLDAVLEQAEGRIPVLAGTGSASTARAVEQTRLAASHGADAALVVTPYYNRPVQRGLEAHFRAVADQSSIPVVLYNVPGRTAVDMLPETVERLATHEAIIGIKEAVGRPDRIDELLARCGDAFIVLSGDDHSCAEAMEHGAQGVISVASNVVPGKMHQLVGAVRSGDKLLAQSIDLDLSQLFDFLMIETNPIPVKWLLFEMGLIGPHIRLPMTPLDKDLREKASACLRLSGLIPD